MVSWQVLALWVQVGPLSQSSLCYFCGLWHPLSSPSTNLTKLYLTNSKHIPRVWFILPATGEHTKSFVSVCHLWRYSHPTSAQGNVVEMWERVTARKYLPLGLFPTTPGADLSPCNAFGHLENTFPRLLKGQVLWEKCTAAHTDLYWFLQQVVEGFHLSVRRVRSLWGFSHLTAEF